VTKTATLFGVSRATVSEVMSLYTNRGKTTSAARNSGRKLKRDRRALRTTVSKNHTTTSAAQVTAELNIHLAVRVSTKTARRDVSFTNPTSTVGMQLLNF
jgi:hypothetical protein